MTDIDQIKNDLQDLAPKAVAAIGVRAVMRALPRLASRSEGAQAPFAIWPSYRRSQHILAIFRCQQVSAFLNSSSNSIGEYASNNLADVVRDVQIIDFGSGAAADASIAAHVATVGIPNGSTMKRVVDAAAIAINFASYVHAVGYLNFSTDVAISRANADINALCTSPLWSHGIPDDVYLHWMQLSEDLRSLDAGFDVWIDWYRDRLEGRPIDRELERKWALLPDNILDKTPIEINAHLRSLRDEHLRSPFPPDAPPEIPQNQEPGLQFAAQDDGTIDLRPSGFATPDDVAEILAMRGVIVEALDDLLILLAGSNAYPLIAQVADRYKSAISADKLSVDLLYACGVRLENSRTRLEAEIKSGDCPTMAVPAGEALDSVIALHGPVVYSTARGNELVERARAFAADGLDVSVYKPTAQRVATAIGKAEEAVTELAREAIRQASDEIGEGKHPERSTQIARSGFANFMIAAAKGMQQALRPEVMTETMTKGAYMAATTAAVTGLGFAAYTTAPALLSFFMTNKALLHDFSMAAGCELSWLPSFLQWLEMQQASLKSYVMKAPTSLSKI